MHKFSLLAALTACAVQPIGKNVTLTVSSGDGGKVVGTGIDCGSDCSEELISPATLSLQAIPDKGYTLDAWAGACSGSTDLCELLVEENTDTSVAFVPLMQVLNVVVVGGGSVSDMDGNIDQCVEGGDTCSVELMSGTQLTLAATADSGFEFVGWGSTCAGVGPCDVTVDGNTTVTATFVQMVAVNIDIGGSGSGSVAADGVSGCTSASCTSTIVAGSLLSFTATPDPGFFFLGWSGDCTGHGPCELEASADINLHAAFVPQLYASNAPVAGSGGVNRVWSVRGDGTQAQALSENGFNPRWRPDGQAFVFTAVLPCAGTGAVVSNIFTADADGSNVTCLTGFKSAGAWQPAWSPDGTRVVFSSNATVDAGSDVDHNNGYANVWTIDRDGGDLRAVTAGTGTVDNTVKGSAWVNGLIVLDSSRALDDASVSTGVRNVWLYDVATDTLLPLTSGTGYSSRDPQLSPDGARVIYWSNPGGTADIWMVNSDGSDAHALTSNVDSSIGSRATWTGDGGAVLFISNASGPTDFDNQDALGRIKVFSISVADGTVTDVLGSDAPTGASFDWPALTPDGAQLVCEAFVGSSRNLVLVNPDGTGFTALTASTGDQSFSPDDYD